MSKIQGWKNHYARQRCFILGNGPSLAKMNLSHLKNEISFGTNSIALLFLPRHMVLCAKTILSSKEWKAAARLGVNMSEHSFVSERMTRINFSSGKITVFEDAAWLGEKRTPFADRERKWFSDDPTVRPFCKTFSSGTVMQQLAVYLGCNPIYMIGFDGGYVKQERVGDDPNHFSSGYWGNDLKPIKKVRADEINASSLDGHRYAKEYCDAHAAEIYNATLGGNVDVFERVDYESIFAR